MLNLLLALILLGSEVETPMIINSIRTYSELETKADVFVNGAWFGESLEDIGRPLGVKVQDETSIPEGVYQVKISYSNHFKKPMLILFNHEDDHSIRNGGIKFTGIRVHSGNKTSHTSGCILLPMYTVLQSQVEKAIFDGETVYWVISRA
jgi:hypothetical protein